MSKPADPQPYELGYLASCEKRLLVLSRCRVGAWWFAALFAVIAVVCGLLIYGNSLRQSETPISMALPDDTNLCRPTQQGTKTTQLVIDPACTASLESELAFVRVSSELSKLKEDAAKEMALETVYRSRRTLGFLLAAIVMLLVAWVLSRPWMKDGWIAASEIAEASKEAFGQGNAAEPAGSVRTGPDRARFPTGLIWSAMLDSRFSTMLKAARQQIFESGIIGSDLPYVGSDLPYEARERLWREVGGKLAKDPAFLSLIEEKAQKGRYRKSLSSLVDKFRGKEGTARTDAQGSVLLLLLLGGLVPLTGYVAANAVDRTLERQLSDTNSKLERLDTQLREFSETEQVIVKEGGSKEVEKDRDFTLYYPVQIPASTPGKTGGSNGGSNPGTPEAITQTCAPSETVTVSSSGAEENNIQPLGDKENKPAETKGGITQVCSSQQKVTVDNLPPPPNKDRQSVSELHPVLLEIWRDHKVIGCGAVSDNASTDKNSGVSTVEIPIVGAVADKTQNPPKTCFTFSYAFKKHVSSGPVCLDATEKDATGEHSFPVFVDKPPIFNDRLNARVSIEQSPGFGGWPPTHWLAKTDVLVIRISPESSPQPVQSKPQPNQPNPKGSSCKDSEK